MRTSAARIQRSLIHVWVLKPGLPSGWLLAPMYDHENFRRLTTNFIDDQICKSPKYDAAYFAVRIVGFEATELTRRLLNLFEGPFELFNECRARITALAGEVNGRLSEVAIGRCSETRPLHFAGAT
jgi:hypothetical protein